MICKHNRRRLLSLSTYLFLFAFVCTCFGESMPEVGELVGRYKEALYWNQKVSMYINTKIDSEGTREDGRVFHQEMSLIYRRDRERIEWIGSLSAFEDQEHEVPKYTDQTIVISNGQNLIAANKRIGEDQAYVGSIWHQDYKKALRSIVLDYYRGGFIHGIIGGLGEAHNLAEFFSQNNTVHIVGKENIDDVSCYIVEAKTNNNSTITAWIAPQKGYNALKISERANNENWSKLIDSIEVQKTDGIFIPVSGRFTKINKQENGGERIVHVHVKCSQIDLNPDFEALDAFELALPDGSRIYDQDSPGIIYDVSGGKLVPNIIEPQSLIGKPLPDIKELVKNGDAENNIQQNDKQIKPAAQPDEPDSQKSFLNAEEILAKWESTYGSIKSMSVSYNNILVEYKPPANNSNEPPPIPTKYQYVKRVEEGKRYHIRYSGAKNGFNNYEYLVEFAFNGETTQNYMGSTRRGSIIMGQRGGNEEDMNVLKEYMFLQNRNAPSYLQDDYPNGMPELQLCFKRGILRGKVTVLPNLESVAGQLCHVVEIELPEQKVGPSRYKRVFWLAHDKGMCLMKCQWWDNQRLETYKLKSEIEVKQLAVATIDGTDIWYPINAQKRLSNDIFGTIKDELTVTEFVPNIEVDENTFRIDFPPGTNVVDRIRNITYTISSKEPKSLLEKTPPKLSDFGTELAQANIKDKSLLVCFFDMQQRPSRNCMKGLAIQAGELKEKDIVVVAIQATKLDEKTLDDWIKQNNILFPVGMIRADEEKTRIAWGIRSLPWLILTDKQHIVRAEGFALEELDKKIMNSK